MERKSAVSIRYVLQLLLSILKMSNVHLSNFIVYICLHFLRIFYITRYSKNISYNFVYLRHQRVTTVLFTVICPQSEKIIAAI